MRFRPCRKIADLLAYVQVSGIINWLAFMPAFRLLEAAFLMARDCISTSHWTLHL